MKLFLRFVLYGCLSAMFSISFSHAQVEDPTDCNETSNYTEQQYATKVKELVAGEPWNMSLKIFTEKDLKAVLRYHQQYCCERRTQDTKCEGKLEGQKWYPESPYIFDHLINVGMRKFDAVEETCDTLGIDCKTQDNQVQLIEWRTKVRELALETDGNPPSLLLELFKEYRGEPADFTKNQNKIANAYFQMCNEAAVIRKAVTINAGAIDNKLTWDKGLFAVCADLVRQRYVQEAAFVQTLMVEKGIQYMYKNMSTYFQEYFITNRMNDLVDKFGKLDACFNMVLKYVTRTECCVY